MDEFVRQKLIALNRDFYERFGASFSGTRFGAQPGWHPIIHYFPRRCTVLDLGCGNARLALFLDALLEDVHYVGLEGSETLVAIAREKTAQLSHVRAECLLADLSAAVWPSLPVLFDVVTAFAVLHHIPGFDARVAFVRTARRYLKPDGVLILSNWRFTHNERMRRKLLPWPAAGLREADIEPGDYLLDWKKDGGGMRYVHELDASEVEAIASATGLRILEQFVADGREGDLSLYTVLAPEKTPRPDDAAVKTTEDTHAD